MNVYITYDRYERDEWYSVYNIDTSLTCSLNQFKEVDLPSFLEYGPDDCHSFQLQKVSMTKKDYEQLMSWMTDPSQTLENYGKESSDFFNFMVSIFDSNEGIIRSTDGCTDLVELPHFYGLMSHQDTSDDVVYDEIMERLQEDEDLFKLVLKEYIRCNY